jgi:hypothetical protein
MSFKTEGRRLRTIPVLAWGPDPLATAVTNADAILHELTSRRRLSTLAQLPTSEAIMGAIETIAAWKRGRGDKAEQDAILLRARCSGWIPTVDVPTAISDAARALMMSLGAIEPPCGWDDDTGYPDVWADVAEIRGTTIIMKGTASEKPSAEGNPCAEEERSSWGDEVSRRATKLAQAMCQALNLAGVFASPRVLSKATELPSREHVLEHLDAFSEAFPGSSIDNDTMRGAVARLRAGCATWTPGPEAAPEVQEAARALLAAFGLPEPPGGWDAFEGFPEPEPEDPDPRLAPTPEEEAARPELSDEP